jgi:DNA-directed RNA polymerase specialized sigma24 family protein
MEDARLVALVERTIEGDGAAWRALWLAVEPMLWAITAQRRLTSQLCRDVDERSNIVLRVMDQLRADDFHRLRLFRASLARRRHGSFRSWLATVAARSAISYLRKHPEYLGPRDPSDARRGRWAELEPLPVELEEPGLDPLLAFDGRHVFEHARRRLTPAQLRALVLWLQGSDHREIALEIQLADDRLAALLVRSALKRLRDRFAAP